MARPKGMNLVSSIIDDEPKLNEKKEKKQTFVVRVTFDKEDETLIKSKARSKGLGLATFIKMCVYNEINK